MMNDGANARERSRERDRSRRGDKPTRFSDAGRDRSRDRSRDSRDRGRDKKRGSNHRVYVSNISYEYRWQDLKDLFRTHVGEVLFFDLFVDENDKPRGCGIVEFADEKSVKKCLSVMHRFDLKGRKLVVREDFGNERDKYGNIINNRRERDRDNLPDLRDEVRLDRGNNLPSLMNISGPSGGGDASEKWGNTYGLSPQFLESLDIRGPLLHRVFVANLDYKVDEKKLAEVFKLAGKVLSVELTRDKDGNSRGFGVIEYDHTVESVQAISMLNGQQLYDRKLIVRMDRDRNDGPLKLPEGLKAVGMGLGENGDPLRDISRNLPSNVGSNHHDNNMNSGSGILGPMPGQPLQGLSSTAAALNSVISGGSGLAGLASSQAAAIQASLAGVGGLSNPILAGGLSNVGDFALANLGNSTLNASLMSNSLAQNASLAASLAANNLNNPGNLGGSLGNNAGLGNNNYQRHDNSNFLSNSSNSNQYNGPSRDRLSNRDNYLDNRDYDSMNRSFKTEEPDIDFRSNSVYSTVNNGSQGRHSQLAPRMNDTIIVNNLPPSATRTTLRDKFRSFGDITHCEMKDNDVGIIRFLNQHSAKDAVDVMDRARVDGRTIDVSYL